MESVAQTNIRFYNNQSQKQGHSLDELVLAKQAYEPAMISVNDQFRVNRQSKICYFRQYRNELLEVEVSGECEA